MENVFRKTIFLHWFSRYFSMNSETAKRLHKYWKYIKKKVSKDVMFWNLFCRMREKSGKLINVLYQIRTSCVENFLKINRRPGTFIWYPRVVDYWENWLAWNEIQNLVHLILSKSHYDERKIGGNWVSCSHWFENRFRRNREKSDSLVNYSDRDL